MRLRSAAGFLAAACLSALLAGGAHAQLGPSLTTTHYRFVPRASVLHQSQGFAGVDIDYNVVGTFDFIVTPSLLAVYPPVLGGDFDNVVAAGVRGFQNYALKLDNAINLSGLQGGTGIRGPINVFQFRGKTGDGSSVELWAAKRGAWMYLRGGTTPPPGSADYFVYDIKALAHERPFADFNDDGQVDGADLATWSAPAGRLNTDFLSWQRQYGEIPPAEADFEAAITAASQSAATTTPEPAGLALMLAGAFAAATARRRQVANAATAHATHRERKFAQQT
jgi:hypothetical protein